MVDEVIDGQTFVDVALTLSSMAGAGAEPLAAEASPTSFGERGGGDENKGLAVNRGW
ncbi:MAG TPA: hypothetical protein V6D20_22020 [Candidatus Obscuribacterales bacterium]